MNLKKLTLVALLPLATACQSLQRWGKDAAVLGTSWLTIPLSSVRDSLDWGEETGSTASIVLLPVNVPLHAVKHTIYTLIYGVDFCLAPIYLAASIPQGYDLKPIDLYSSLRRYPWPSEPWPGFEE